MLSLVARRIIGVQCEPAKHRQMDKGGVDDGSDD